MKVYCSAKVAQCVIMGEVIFIRDPNEVRSNWRLGIVSRVDPGTDSRTDGTGETVDNDQGCGYITVQRAVNQLIVLVPADREDDKNRLKLRPKEENFLVKRGNSANKRSGDQCFVSSRNSYA